MIKKNKTIGLILWIIASILLIFVALNNPIGCLTEEDCAEVEQEIYLGSSEYFCEEITSGFYDKQCRGGGYGGVFSCNEYCVVDGVKFELYKIDDNWELIK